MLVYGECAVTYILVISDFEGVLRVVLCLQLFDAVGWTTGRAKTEW